MKSPIFERVNRSVVVPKRANPTKIKNKIYRDYPGCNITEEDNVFFSSRGKSKAISFTRMERPYKEEYLPYEVAKLGPNMNRETKKAFLKARKILALEYTGHKYVRRGSLIHVTRFLVIDIPAYVDKDYGLENLGLYKYHGHKLMYLGMYFYKYPLEKGMFADTMRGLKNMYSELHLNEDGECVYTEYENLQYMQHRLTDIFCGRVKEEDFKPIPDEYIKDNFYPKHLMFFDNYNYKIKSY